MSKQKPSYRIAPPRDRLRIWGADGHARAAEQPGGKPDNEKFGLQGSNRSMRDSKIYSNSFGEQHFMTVARSIYKAPQQETDRGGGYVLVRWMANP